MRRHSGSDGPGRIAGAKLDSQELLTSLVIGYEIGVPCGHCAACHRRRLPHIGGRVVALATAGLGSALPGPSIPSRAATPSALPNITEPRSQMMRTIDHPDHGQGRFRMGIHGRGYPPPISLQKDLPGRPPYTMEADERARYLVGPGQTLVTSRISISNSIRSAGGPNRPSRAALELQKQHGFSVDAIKSIRIENFSRGQTPGNKASKIDRRSTIFPPLFSRCGPCPWHDWCSAHCR